jgi:hypothetical protein
MGEKQNQPFQLSFNASLKVDFQGSRVTSDGGLILVRELDERLRFNELIEQHLTGSRGKKKQLPLTDLLRQSLHSAEGWDELLLPEIERQQDQGKEVVFRADAAFAKPEVYGALVALNAENPTGNCPDKRLGICCELTGKSKRKFRLRGAGVHGTNCTYF